VIKYALENMKRTMDEKKWAAFADRDYILGGTHINLIALGNKPTRPNLSWRNTQAMQLLFDLDHEIGHHILKNGFQYPGVSGQTAESAADAYAMLRHIQRFGKNTDYAGAYSKEKAFHVVLESDAEHYTSDAVLRAIQLADEMGEGIFKLSLRETAARAEKIADDCHLDDRRLKKIHNAFRPAAEAHNRKKSAMIIHGEIISVMRKYRRDPDVFNAGKRFLSRPSDKKIIKELAQTDRYWQKVSDFLENRRTTLPRRGPIRFMKKTFRH
jgi:hypothetical protein